MAMPRPPEMETAPRSKDIAENKPLDGSQKSEEEHVKYPRKNNAADRVKSSDWVGDFKKESSAIHTFPKDVFGRGVDSIPMPLETSRFVPDALFDDLQSTEMQENMDTSTTDGHQVAYDSSIGAETDQSAKPAPFGVVFDADADDAELDTLLPRLPLPRECPVDYQGQPVEEQGEPYSSSLPSATSKTVETNESCTHQDMGEDGLQATQSRRDSSATSSLSARTAHATDVGLTPPSHINSNNSLETSTPQLSSVPGSAAPSPLAMTPSKASYEPSKGFCVPNDRDVLMGRGGLTNHHAGNKRYRKQAAELKPWYDSCGTKTEKKELSQLLVDYIHNYGGRFLKRDAKDRWYEVAQNTARKKASQALREGRDGKKQKTTDEDSE